MLLPTKKCSKCGRVLLACKKNFAKHKGAKYGFNSQCKECKKKYNKQWREHNSDYHKQWRQDNSEHLKQYHLQWYQDNKEEHLEKSRQYYQDNYEHIKQHMRQYSKQHYQDNKESIKEYHKQWREDNPDYHKQHYQVNKEQYSQNMKQWHKYNPDYNSQYYQVNKESIKEYNKQRWDNYLQENGLERSQGSYGEQKVRQVLNQSNITFVEQHKFDDCKFHRPLPFDFYIPNLNTIIEYDGAQHFNIVDYYGGLDGFIETIIRDTIKNDYCRRNNIRLIRIPYYEFDNIETILSDLL